MSFMCSHGRGPCQYNEVFPFPSLSLLFSLESIETRTCEKSAPGLAQSEHMVMPRRHRQPPSRSPLSLRRHNCSHGAPAQQCPRHALIARLSQRRRHSRACCAPAHTLPLPTRVIRAVTAIVDSRTVMPSWSFP